MGTPYSEKNARFSNIAHQKARKEIYPLIFGVPLEDLSFEDTLLELNDRGEIFNGEMAIDRIVKVKTRENRLQQPTTFTVQERFRRPEYTSSQDLTITEWNTVSNLPSELYKITANHFVYGYFYEKEDQFGDVVVTNVSTMLMKIGNKELKYTRHLNHRSKQYFIAITFKDLRQSGCVIYEQHPPKPPGWLPQLRIEARTGDTFNLDFKFDVDFKDDLKDCIPRHARGWSPKAKRWWVSWLYLDGVLQITDGYFDIEWSADAKDQYDKLLELYGV